MKVFFGKRFEDPDRRRFEGPDRRRFEGHAVMFALLVASQTVISA